MNDIINRIKDIFVRILCRLIPIAGTYIGYCLYNEYHTAGWYSAYTFIFGFLLGLIAAVIASWVHSIKINQYKRRLEKESVVSEENSARDKVLESKIEVLEKALENALKK